MRGTARRGWRPQLLLTAALIFDQLQRSSVASPAGPHDAFPQVFAANFPRSRWPPRPFFPFPLIQHLTVLGRSMSPLSHMVREAFSNSEKAGEEETRPQFVDPPRSCKNCMAKNVTRYLPPSRTTQHTNLSPCPHASSLIGPFPSDVRDIS